MANLPQKRLLRQTVEIPDHPVVVHDPHLRSRKDDRKEGLGTCGSVLATPPGGSHACGGGRAMVTIGDVERRHGAEDLADLRQACRLLDDPDRVPDAVIRRHIGNRHALGSQCDQPLGRRAVRVGKQHRPGLCIERLDLAYPVVFLVRPGELVLADAVALVGGDRGSSDQPRLDVLAHDQPIGVVAWVRITAKHPAVYQALKVRGRPGVHLRSIVIDIR